MKRYSEYKDSGVEWIGEIPSHWEVKKIKYIFDILGGGTPSSTEESYWDGDIRWITPKDIDENVYVEDTSRTISMKGVNNSSAKLIKKDSIVITTRAPIGNICINRYDTTTNQGCHSLINSKNKNEKFYYYYMNSIKDILIAHGKGTTFIELSKQGLENIYVVDIPIFEQNKIVSYLDKKTSQIETLISKKEELIEALKASRHKLISRTVTKGIDKNAPMKDSGIEWIGEIPKHWSICKVKHMLEEGKDGIRMGPFGSNLKLDEMNPEYEYKVYGQENLIYQDFELGDRFINYQKFSTMKQYEVFDGDILISTMGTVGKIDIFRDKYKKGIIDSHLIRVRVNSKLISPEYIKLLINESKYIKDNLNMQSKGSIMEGLNSTIIKNIVVARPPVSEQISITEYITNNISKIDNLISKTEEQIELLKKAKQKLITEVVTGKIDVTNL